jgi:hypothetical protein
MYIFTHNNTKNAPSISAYCYWCKTVCGARNIVCILIVTPEKCLGATCR